MNESYGQFKRALLARVHTDGDVAQTQIKRQLKVILLRKDCSKRPAKKTVRARRIPRHDEAAQG
jgi:hypothetical protein